MLSYKPIWFDGFVGLGYSFKHVYPRLLILFDNKKRLREAWDKVIKLWPDDEIKIRFVEIRIEDGHDSPYIIGNRKEVRDKADEEDVRGYGMESKEENKSKSKGKYVFIMYCRSRILESTWVFLKLLDISDNYTRLKDEYDEKVYVDLALYIPKGESYELEIFKYRKSVSDVAFIDARIVQSGADIGYHDYSASKEGKGEDKEDEAVGVQLGEGEDKDSIYRRGVSAYNYSDDYDISIVRGAMRFLSIT